MCIRLIEMSNKNTSSKIIAIFDFDGTITFYDTLIPFFCFAFGKVRTTLKLLPLLPKLALFPLGFLSRQQAKEVLLTAFLKDLPLEQGKEMGARFAEEKLPSYIKKDALQKILWHQSLGHTCVLVSANIDLFLQPWARRVGFQYILSSVLEVSRFQLFTGKLKGANCWGLEKKRRVLELLGPKENYELYVYGDSRGDRDLLELADHPFFRTFCK